MHFFSGERVIPHNRHLHFTFLRHLVVYQWAASMVLNRRVLDAGCGDGYGTWLLSDGAASALGVDRSIGTIQRAQEVYRRQNLRFSSFDLRGEWPLADSSVDVVTSFQVIEHLPHSDGFIREVNRVLAPGGHAIVSTPNRLTFSPDGILLDPYHYREYMAREFAHIFQPFFNRVTILGLSGNERIQKLLERDRSVAQRVTRYDFLHFWTRAPRPLRRWVYSAGLNILRAFHRSGDVVQLSDFEIVEHPFDQHRVLDIIALCQK